MNEVFPGYTIDELLEMSEREKGMEWDETIEMNMRDHGEAIETTRKWGRDAAAGAQEAIERIARGILDGDEMYLGVDPAVAGKDHTCLHMPYTRIKASDCTLYGSVVLRALHKHSESWFKGLRDKWTRLSKGGR